MTKTSPSARPFEVPNRKSNATVKASVEMAIKAGIRDDVKQILGKHGATNLTTLKEAKYGEFAADLDTALLNA